MYTVSWQPGRLKGFTEQQTAQIIIRGLQYWQAVCRVRFGTVPHGSQANIRIYPYSGNMNGAFMGTYVETGQIIYTTNVEADIDFCRMAIAHEVGHCFRLGHVSRPGALMYWRGSEDRYFDPQEARASWNTFGKYVGYHWPYSLKFVGDKVRAAKAAWEKADLEWEELKKEREAEKNIKKRAALNTKVLAKLEVRKKAQQALTAASSRWTKLHSAWRAIGGIKMPPTTRAEQEALKMAEGVPETLDAIAQSGDFVPGSGVYTCCNIHSAVIKDPVDVKKIFEGLDDTQQKPLEGIESLV